MLLYHGPSKRTRFSQLMVKYKNFAMNHTLANAIRIPSTKKQIRIAIRRIPAIQTVISFFQPMLALQPRHEATLSAAADHLAAACELVLEALVAQRRITRKSGGYVRVPHEGPSQGPGYKGFDPLGGLEI